MTLLDLVYGRARRSEPVTAAAVASLGGLDYADAVAVPLPAGTTAVEFCRRSLQSTPGWVRWLLAARDRLVRPLGLKGATDLHSRDVVVERGRALGPLVVLAVADDEVLLGDDDKHLSFRTSFAVRDTGAGREGVCSTAVRFHNRAGRAYFVAIRPFHRVVIPAIVGHTDHG